MSEQKQRGRKAGTSSKKCLIKDDLIHPYEIHIDEGSHTYLLVHSETQLNEAYYTTLAHCLKGILKRKLVPADKVYTLRQYQQEMLIMEQEMKKLLGV